MPATIMIHHAQYCLRITSNHDKSSLFLFFCRNAVVRLLLSFLLRYFHHFSRFRQAGNYRLTANNFPYEHGNLFCRRPVAERHG